MKKFTALLKIAITAVLTYNFIKLVHRRFTTPNRLFFYSNLKDFKEYEASFRIATISKHSFSIESPVRAFAWFEYAVSAARGKNKWLFLYNLDGSACTAIIDRNYVFYIKKTYRKGELSLPWLFITVDGKGDLMLVGYKKFGEEDIPVGFAQIQDDGSYVEWWRSRIKLPDPVWVKGLPMGHGWFAKNQEGIGGTFFICDIKHNQVITSRSFEDEWDGVACEANLFYFWNSTWRSEICELDQNNQLITIRVRYIDEELANGRPFNQVTSSGGLHFCWEQAIGGSLEPRIRTLSRDGFPITHEVKLNDWWYNIMPC